MDPTTELDIGIVGLGTHGRHRARLLDNAGQRVFGADASKDARNQFDRKFEKHHVTDPEGLFEMELDGIIIATPNKFHAPAAIEAMERGHDVFIEKPLAHTLEAARTIQRVAESTGRLCMVGYQSRFLNVCKILKQYIDEGFFGEIRHVETAYRRRRGVPGRGSWYTAKEIAGGGALIDIGIHVFDLLLYFLEETTVTEMMATTRCDFGSRESYAYLDMWGEDDDANMFDVEDSVSAFLSFSEGTTATVEVAWATNAESAHQYHIHGTEAGALLDITDVLNASTDVHQSLTFYEARTGGAHHYLDSTVTTTPNDPYVAQMETFLEAVATGRDPSINTLEQALAIQRLVHRIYADNGELIE
ncbi:Gfo/Idh/MocA family protein [Halocatena halophila]|uniref:Gfo/Idh/MocA family protein n=1 Tax=Halocatena halophila TaxID=2814576 RepID=UPI002ED1C0CB